MATPEPPEAPQPAPFVPLPPSPGPACSTCGDRPVAQWRRRPTDSELAALVTAEEARRAEALLLADPEDPPVFPPLPSTENTTIPVYGCAQHAIHVDAAARIHEPHCSGCDCDPEPLPPPTPMLGSEPTIALPTGWTIPAPTKENA